MTSFIGMRVTVDRDAAIMAGKGLGGNSVYAGEINISTLTEKQRKILTKMFPYPDSLQAELKPLNVPPYGEAIFAYLKDMPKYPEPADFFTPIPEATVENAKQWLAEAEIFSDALTEWLEKYAPNKS